MKRYSLIFIGLLLLFSCAEQKENSTSEITANLQAANDSNNPPAIRFEAARRAFLLSDTINNDTLRFQSIVTEYDIFSELYPDSATAHLGKIKLLARSSSQKGTYFLRKGLDQKRSEKYIDAYKSYQTAKQYFDTTKDSVRIAYALLQMAEIAGVFNDYNGSQETAAEALVYLSNSDRVDYKVQAYNLLGITYVSLQEYGKAIESYRQALQTDDELNKDVIRNNIAYVYVSDHQYPKAIAILSGLLKKETINSNPLEKARVLHSLGYSLSQLDPSKGLPEMERALQIRLEKNERQDLVFSYLDMSDYHKQRNPSLAKKYSEMALHTAGSINAVDQKIQALMQLVKLNNTDEAKKLFLDYETLNDSISTVRRVAKNEFAKQKYDFRKADQENALLKIQNLRSERRNLLYGIAIGLIVIVSGLCYYSIRKRHARAKKREAYMTETRISKKIHDELANDIFHTIAFAENQDLSAFENKETLLHNLDNIYSRTRDISRENSSIDTGEAFPAQFKDMISGYNSTQTAVLIIGLHDVPWATVPTAIKIELYRIVQELMVNMKKHSHCKRVVLTFGVAKNSITLDYTDDGRGLPQENNFRKNGLFHMENRIKTINGSYTFGTATTKGFKASFILPLK